ncbi:hypothetical protein [Bradyrhizobium sp. CCGUVB1N3]|nr:hypothetical protein [Bradyrhizobium sp. CCGUVB1N3]
MADVSTVSDGQSKMARVMRAILSEPAKSAGTRNHLKLLFQAVA